MTARSKVAKILKSAKASKSYLTQNEEIALQRLKSDTSIKILKFQKDNSTIVMDSSTYDVQLLTIFEQLPDKPNFLNPVVHATNKIVWQLKLHKNDWK